MEHMGAEVLMGILWETWENMGTCPNSMEAYSRENHRIKWGFSIATFEYPRDSYWET